MHVSVLATLIPLLVRWLPLHRVLRIFSGKSQSKKPSARRASRLYAGISPDRIVQIVRHRLRAPRMMKRRPCLREGLLLFYFLRRAGFAPILRFAVYPPALDPNRLHAHCWVTLDGQPLNDEPQGEYAVVLTAGGDQDPHLV
jgi:hypothetical protein